MFIVLSFVFRSIEAIGGTTLVTTSSIVLSESFPTDVGFSRVRSKYCSIYVI